jgi:recombinational DNA repair protein RecT
LGKGVDDLIVAHGTEAFDAAVEAALSLDTWKALGYSHLSYTPNIQVNRRYLGDIQLPELGQVHRS